MQAATALILTLSCACLIHKHGLVVAEPDPQRVSVHHQIQQQPQRRLDHIPIASSDANSRVSMAVPTNRPSGQSSIGFGSMFTQFLTPEQKQRQYAAIASPSLTSSPSSPEGRLLQQMPTSYCAPYGGSVCKKYMTPTSFVYYNLTTVSLKRLILASDHE